jgi:uncharacterized OB-fold protein
MTEMHSADRPQPRHDPVSDTYWRACRDHKLLIQRCPSCGDRQFYPRALCTTCGGTPEWEEASGRGTIHTYTVIRQNYAKPFRDLLPYVVAMIALDEGPMLMANVTGCDPDSLAIDTPVEVWFDDVDDETAIPYWRVV